MGGSPEGSPGVSAGGSQEGVTTPPIADRPQHPSGDPSPAGCRGGVQGGSVEGVPEGSGSSAARASEMSHLGAEGGAHESVIGLAVDARPRDEVSAIAEMKSRCAICGCLSYAWGVAFCCCLLHTNFEKVANQCRADIFWVVSLCTKLFWNKGEAAML